MGHRGFSGPVLILASASRARRRLLRKAGFRFRVVVSNVRETKRGPLGRVVLENARRKAAAVALIHPDAWVLAADTLIRFRGRLYGKPRSRAEALALLTRLSGRTHELATGVALRRGKRVSGFVARSFVTMRFLGRDEIRAVLKRGDPSRFAGGYAVRRGRDPLVESIRGSFTNVVGLPMERVVAYLKLILGMPLRTATKRQP